MFSPLKKNTKECFLALDIGTEAVKALVFEKDNQAYSILGSALQYFDELKPFNNDKVIFQAGEEAIKESRESPKYLLASLPPNLLRNKVDLRVIIRESPKEEISKKEEQDILGRVFEETKKAISHSPKDLQFINLEILGIKIDGYEVPGLKGYSGEKAEFKILASFLPKEQFDNFNKVLSSFDLKSLKIVNPINNLGGIAGINNGVFIDIGGRFTNICVMRNGKIEMVEGFEMGGRDFSRVFSQNLGMLEGEARMFKEKYSLGELAEQTRDKIKEMLASSVQEWQSQFGLKLKNLKGSLPYDFFLFGGGSLLPGLMEGTGAAKVKIIYPQDIKNIIDNTHRVNSPQYINSILLIHG